MRRHDASAEPRRGGAAPPEENFATQDPRITTHMHHEREGVAAAAEAGLLPASPTAAGAGSAGAGSEPTGGDGLVSALSALVFGTEEGRERVASQLSCRGCGVAFSFLWCYRFTCASCRTDFCEGCISKHHRVPPRPEKVRFLILLPHLHACSFAPAAADPPRRPGVRLRRLLLPALRRQLRRALRSGAAAARDPRVHKSPAVWIPEVNPRC